MMDFPSSPTIGQAANGYIWNGYAWTSDVPAGSVTDGDKGDVVVSGSGAVWTLDTAVTTSINNKVAKAGDTMSGQLGIDAPIPTENWLHVKKGSAGTPPAWVASDVALFENASGQTTAIQIQSAPGNNGALIFSDDVRRRGAIDYIHPTDTLQAFSSGPINLVTTGAVNITHNAAGHIFANAAGAVNFMTVNANQIAISPTTASTSPTTGALTVAGGVGVSGDLNGKVAFFTRSGAIGAMLVAADTDATATSQTAVAFKRSSSFVGTINTTNVATSYNTSSDGRLKECLEDFDSGAMIDKLRAGNFRWKVNGERDYGVIAQDAAKVLPQAVVHDEKQDWWGIDYSKFVPILLAEVKALRARLAEMERRHG